MRRSALRVHFSWASALVAAALCMAGCEHGGIAEPTPIGDVSAPLQSQAFILAFNLRTGTVSIAAPTGGLIRARPQINASFSASGAAAPTPAGISNSLLGTGLVELRSSNFRASAIGAVEPGKVLIRIDLTVVNLLNAALVTPTFPSPPPGVTGVQAFPLEILVASSPDGPLVVSPPETGPVQPSLDWSGAPHNFLNDVACGAPSSDCFRYEPFPNIAPLGVSEPRTVGFLVNPTVAEFRVAMLLAANIQAPAAP